MNKIIREFREFAFKGNVIDMAVGVLIGSAFSGMVTSLVNDLFTPLLALLTGSVDFSHWVVPLGSGADAPRLAIGSFVQTVVNFLIVAVCIFAMVKFINRLKRPAPKTAPRLCPYCRGEIAAEATRCPHCTSHLE